MTTETLPAVRQVPVEPTTPIKASEAIRLGCLIAPVQAFGGLSTAAGNACVIGAMYLGFGAWDGNVETSLDIDLDSGPAAEAWEALPLSCPIPDCSQGQVAGPAHLNDDHRWSRERIADWLAEQGL